MRGNIEPTPVFECSETRRNREDACHDYGLVDYWGRAVGCRITTWESSYEVIERIGRWEFELFKTRERAEGLKAQYEARGLFGLYAHQTRGGSDYGALNNTRYFKTREERDAAISKYLKQARKTAEKGVAKQKAVRAQRVAVKAG